MLLLLCFGGKVRRVCDAMADQVLETDEFSLLICANLIYVKIIKRQLRSGQRRKNSLFFFFKFSQKDGLVPQEGCKNKKRTIEEWPKKKKSLFFHIFAKRWVGTPRTMPMKY